MKIKNAIISLSNKEGIKDLLKLLKKFRVNLISSGGTYKFIKKLGYECTEISDYTNFPEILDGRVKTLHPKIYAGILSKRNKKHTKDLKKFNFKEIDMVICNFYPFEFFLKKSSNHEKILEKIDIGGPTLVRAAAKNYKDVVVVSSINQYHSLKNELLRNNGSTSLDFRRRLSLEAFHETGYYDSVISSYFNKITKNKFPEKKLIFGRKVEDLRYGENPHQKAAIYSSGPQTNFRQLSGKKLSYNNYNDIYAALNISKSLPKNRGTVIIKHSNPCGVSIEKNKIKSFKLAFDCDPISSFGGIVCCNFKIKKLMAVELNKTFFEIVISNGIEKKALKILKKKKNLRIIDASRINVDIAQQQMVTHLDNINIQSIDNFKLRKMDFKVVSKVKPNKKEFDELIFAFNICRYVKSNAIVLAKNFTTVGIGTGQPSRIDSCEIAIRKMKKFSLDKSGGSLVAASDAFFPFTDGIEKLAIAGVKSIIQPSGSIRDKDIIKFADKIGISLVFSKTRHFRH